MAIVGRATSKRLKFRNGAKNLCNQWSKEMKSNNFTGSNKEKKGLSA